MRAHILDADALRAISPSALSAFARSEGWRKTESYGAHSDVYAAPGKPEIVLPRTDQLGDYPTVVSRLLAAFSDNADRDEPAIYRMIADSDCDVIRIGTPGAGRKIPVSLDAGISRIIAARDMIASAACALESFKNSYSEWEMLQTSDILANVQFGTDEEDKFKIALRTPVAMFLGTNESSDTPNFEDEPVERQLHWTLLDALVALRSACELSVAGDDLAFETAIGRGASSNLCDAVSRMAGESEGLQIDISFARTRPAPDHWRKVVFSHSDTRILSEAARKLAGTSKRRAVFQPQDQPWIPGSALSGAVRGSGASFVDVIERGKALSKDMEFFFETLKAAGNDGQTGRFPSLRPNRISAKSSPSK